MKLMWQKNEMLRDEATDELDIYSQGMSGGDDVGEFEPLEDENPDGGEVDPSAPAGFDYDKFAAAQAAALAPIITARQPAQQQQRREMTDEEFAKVTKKFVADKTLVDAMFSEHATEETRLAALNNLINGVAQHTLTSAGLLINGEVTSLRQQITPLQERQMQATRDAFEDKVVKDYPDLGPYKKLIGQAVSAIQQSGANPRNDQEARLMVARFIENHVKGFIPTFALRGRRVPTTVTGGRPGMPRQASFAGGGAGGSGGQQGKPQKEAWRSAIGPKKTS